MKSAQLAAAIALTTAMAMLMGITYLLVAPASASTPQALFAMFVYTLAIFVTFVVLISFPGRQE